MACLNTSECFITLKTNLMAHCHLFMNSYEEVGTVCTKITSSYCLNISAFTAFGKTPLIYVEVRHYLLKGVFRFRANFSLAVYFCSLRCLLWSSYFLFWDFLSCHHFGEKVLRHPHQRRRIVSWVHFVSYLWSLKVLFTFSQGQNMFWLISTCLYGIYIIQQLPVWLVKKPICFHI